MSLNFLKFLGVMSVGGVGLLGCGSQSTVPIPTVLNVASTACSMGAAEILVGDGFFQTVCGCKGASEAAGTLFPAPGNLTCHLEKSTGAVYFYFLGTALRHQIISNSTPNFVPSPISNPDDTSSIRVHAVTFPQASTTYSFVDAFTGMKGQIFVPAAAL